MHDKSSAAAIRLFAMVALIAAAATIRAHDIDAAAATRGPKAGNDAGHAPIVLAQGRCFNGRCF